MKIGAVLSPIADWSTVVAGAREADRLGLEAIGLYDHYHSAQPDWGYVAGWSAYGALAAITERVRLVPMVLNALHYQPGVLAKESSVLSIVSGGRFELAIGAGDWPASFTAWGMPFPPADQRLDRLAEIVDALRGVWTGESTTRTGAHVRLEGAISTPAPAEPPRVVVGVGGSRSTLARAVGFADELNVYDDVAVIAAAADAAARADRPIGLSVFVSWDWDHWPADPRAELRRLADSGVGRVFAAVGGPDPVGRISELGALQPDLA